MANVRNKKTAPAPTAASGRATRAPGRKPLPKPKPKPAPKAKKARGRPKGYKAVKNRAEDGSTIKKKRRSMSVASRMKKERDDRRAKKGGSTVEDDDEEVKLPKGAPKPAKVMNSELNSEGLEWEAEKVVGSRLLNNGNREYLVKWVGWPPSNNSWEPAVNLSNSFDLITDFDEANPDAA